MPRPLYCLIAVLLTTLTLVGCRESSGTSTEPDPLNAQAELRDNDVDRGYDRSESDPALLAMLMQVASDVSRTEVNCVDPGELSVSFVRENHEPVALPVPAANVQCQSIDDEEFLFEAFESEEDKLVFIEAKRELLCVRGQRNGTDPSTGVSSWDGLAYVDGGNWIMEPDTAGHRDRVASALGVSAFNMCPDISFDPAPSPELPTD